MLVVGDATGSTSCALWRGVIVTVLPQTLSKKPRGEGRCRLSKLPLSTWLVAPNSTSATAASFRSEVEIGGCTTRVLAEQTAAVDPVERRERSAT
jgi:hypothetical protein